MTKVFENNVECTELMLHILLERSDLQVKTVRSQYTVKNLQGRSVRLDIFALDSADKCFNIEIQRDIRGAGVKRARYNSSVIDANTLLAGEECDDLPEIYVIFITEKDVFGKNKPIYHIERVVKEVEKDFGDGSHIIYVNGEYKDESPIGRLMQDFSCSNPDNMYYKVLADRVRQLKEDEKGSGTMSRVMEEFLADAKRDVAFCLLKRGKMTKEEIAEDTGLSMEIIEEIARNGITA